MNLTPTPPPPRLLVVDGDAALRGALAAAPPALVLLDLRLQGEDGLTLARALRQSSLLLAKGQVPALRLGDGVNLRLAA